MRICVLGAGSLGSAMGGYLAQAGNDVVLINRNAEFCDAVNAEGLRLVRDGHEVRVPVLASRSAEGIAPVDLVIVLVKSKDTETAIRSAFDVLAPETVVLSLQNGLGQEEILASIVGPERVILGKTYVGGQMAGRGRVVAGARDKETIIGEVKGPATGRIRAIAQCFETAGLRTIASDDIMAAVWDKLLVNVATGAVSAITGLDYGNLYDVPEVEATALAAVREAIAVAGALGITLSSDDPRRAWKKASEGLPFEFKASMLQSLEKGSITEIDFVNGSVVRAGKRVGVPTPVNETLVALLKGIERGLDPKKIPQPQDTGPVSASSAYLEHCALNVSDISWHLRFFRQVLGMTVTMVRGDQLCPDQAWTLGGIQLVSRPGSTASPGVLNHLGMAVVDPDAAIEAARAFGVESDPRGDHWLALPDGIVLELLPADARRVERALRLDPRR